MNNWSDSRDLTADALHREERAAARGARRTFLEYSPMRPFDVSEPQRVYRRYSYGPLLDLFVLERVRSSCRTPAISPHHPKSRICVPRAATQLEN